MVTGTSPTARQRELGTRLRGLRNEHNLTVEDVAERLLCSATKISRLETGARRPSLRDVRDLCGIYEVDASTSAELMSLAKGGEVVAAFPVSNSDQIMLVTDGGTLIRCPVDGIRLAGRATRGVRIVNVSEGERVVSTVRIGEDDAGNGNGESHSETNGG